MGEIFVLKGTCVKLRPLTKPKSRLSGCDLTSIAAPELIESNIERTLVSALKLGIGTFGADRTIEILARALKAARSESHE